uniref:Uncharacterized protein n=1 Tax=Romanomermis culicivorax TaxID=13658 RepID=A0A915J948_ROMCU
MNGSQTWLFLLSPGRDGHTCPKIGQWWDSSGATQEAFNSSESGIPTLPTKFIDCCNTGIHWKYEDLNPHGHPHRHFRHQCTTSIYIQNPYFDHTVTCQPILPNVP